MSYVIHNNITMSTILSYFVISYQSERKKKNNRKEIRTKCTAISDNIIYVKQKEYFGIKQKM